MRFSRSNTPLSLARSAQTNNEYIEHAVKLGREAAEKCLERAAICSQMTST